MKTLTLILATLLAASSAFGQTTAEDIVKLALSRHPKIAAAKAAIEAEKAGKGELTSPFKPMASLNGYAAGGDGSMIFSSTVDPINQAMLPSDGVLMGNLMLMWKVWTGGRDSAARSLGDARIKSAEHMLAVVEQDVALGVRLALSDYAFSLGALRAAEADRDAAKEAEKNATTMEQAGKAPRAFVLRAAAEARRAEQDVAKAEASVKTALARLEEATGGPVEVVEGFSIVSGLPTNLDEALQIGADRQELQFFAAMAEALGIEANYVRKSLLPELSIMAMGMSMERANGMSETNAKFGLVFSVPLSDGGMRRSRAKMLEAKAKEFMAQAEEMRLTVRKEIQAAWADWEVADKVVQSSQAGLAAAEESYEVERLRFDSGKSTMAELLDALSMLEMARLSVVEADKYRADSAAKLARAIGD
jgi:outer membrane protein TolC